MNFFVGILIFLSIILGYVLLLKKLFNFNFGKSLFLSVMIIMFLISIFSLLDVLIFGRIVLIIIGLCSFIYSIIMSIIKKENILNYFKCSSFLFFIIGLIIIIGASYKVNILMGWDECSYWATMVKRLYYSNSYLDIQNFHPMYYPPSLTSYNYFVVKLLGMQDKSIYFSQYFLILSSFIYFIEKFNKKHIINAFYTISIIVLFLILLLQPYILTLYSEIPLIMITSIGVLTIVFGNRKIDNLFAFILLFNATLIKSNGLVLCVFPMCIIFFQLLAYFINNLKNKHDFSFKSIIKNIYLTVTNNLYKILVLISPLIAQIAFNIYLKINNIYNPQSIPSSIFSKAIEFIKVIMSRNEIVVKYFDIMSTNINYSTYNMCTIFILITLILMLFFIQLKQTKNIKLNDNKYIIFAVIVSFIVYFLALLYSYCFMFSYGEASILASYDRYMNSFIGTLGLSVFGIFIYSYYDNIKKFRNTLVCTLLIILIIVKFSNIVLFATQILPITSSTTNDNIILGKTVAETYKTCFNENDKIHFIIQGNYGLGAYATIYYMTPLKMYDPRFDGDNWSIRANDDVVEENTTKMTADEYIAYLIKEEFTHVLVIKTSDNFNKNYSDIFETHDGKIIEGIYKFDKTTKKLIYEECNNES